MITVQVDTDAATLRLDQMSDSIHDELLKTVNALTQLLRSYVITDKLSGQVLNFITHHLQQSIQTDVMDNGSSIIGKVYNSRSIAPYGGIHEYGGTIQRYGRNVGDYQIRMPERSFLRSALKDKASFITDELLKAVKRGAAR